MSRENDPVIQGVLRQLDKDIKANDALLKKMPPLDADAQARIQADLDDQRARNDYDYYKWREDMYEGGLLTLPPRY